MKKIKLLFILLLVILSTGCLLGEAGKGYLTKTCMLNENIDGISKKQEYAITHLGNEIQKIVMTNEYITEENAMLFQNLKDSDMSMQINLKNEPGVQITKEIDSEKEYRSIYTFDYLVISDSLKIMYDWNSTYSVLIEKFEDKGYICK